jgi:hypothetical protein
MWKFGDRRLPQLPFDEVSYFDEMAQLGLKERKRKARTRITSQPVRLSNNWLECSLSFPTATSTRSAAGYLCEVSLRSIITTLTRPSSAWSSPIGRYMTR